jgi:hypothetical protein
MNRARGGRGLGSKSAGWVQAEPEPAITPPSPPSP